jgi:hypothetical protein
MTRLHIPRWFIVDAPIFVAGLAGFAVLIVAWAYLQHFKEDPRCEPWCKTAIGIAQDMPKSLSGEIIQDCIVFRNGYMPNMVAMTNAPPSRS